MSAPTEQVTSAVLVLHVSPSRTDGLLDWRARSPIQADPAGTHYFLVTAFGSFAPTRIEESISTLTYAEQAAGVKNRPVASSLLRTMRLADSRVALSDAISTSGGDFAELEMKVAYLTQDPRCRQPRRCGHSCSVGALASSVIAYVGSCVAF